MSTPNARHPLSLPPGSIRAVIALQIAAQFWLLLLLPIDKRVPVPLYMYFLLALMLLAFVGYGHTMLGERSSNALSFVLRAFAVFGTIAVLGYRFYLDPVQLQKDLTPLADQLPGWSVYLGAVLGGFMLGRLVRLGPWRDSSNFQDVQAWISLLAMFGLVVSTIGHAFIFPNSKSEWSSLLPFEAALTGIIALYFGLRS